ncbi:MAG: HNH endonuclease [Planctomycetaceae bacterium]
MSHAYISRSLRALVAEEEKHRCAYCQSAVAIVGMPFEIDHVIPETLGGPTLRGNLCLCCSPCNDQKSCRTTAIDSLTGDDVALFHPRRQVWWQHFRWIDEGLRIEGLTPTGRATVLALQLNRPILVTARRGWINVGWHPPKQPPARKQRPR